MTGWDRCPLEEQPGRVKMLDILGMQHAAAVFPEDLLPSGEPMPRGKPLCCRPLTSWPRAPHQTLDKDRNVCLQYWAEFPNPLNREALGLTVLPFELDEAAVHSSTPLSLDFLIRIMGQWIPWSLQDQWINHMREQCKASRNTVNTKSILLLFNIECISECANCHGNLLLNKDFLLYNNKDVHQVLKVTKKCNTVNAYNEW